MLKNFNLAQLTIEFAPNRSIRDLETTSEGEIKTCDSDAVNRA